MISRHTIQGSFRSQTITIPFVEIVGDRNGPHGFITGGMHGNFVRVVPAEWFSEKCRKNSTSEPETPGQQFFLSNRYGVDVGEPCEVQFGVQLGDQVHAGDLLGNIYYPLRHAAEPLLSPMCGYVSSLWQLNQAPACQRLYSILEEHQCHVERTTLDKFAELTPLDIRKVRM